MDSYDSSLSAFSLDKCVQAFDADLTFKELIMFCEALNLKTKKLPVINQLNANSEKSTANDAINHVSNILNTKHENRKTDALQGTLFLDFAPDRGSDNHGRYRDGL